MSVMIRLSLVVIFHFNAYTECIVYNSDKTKAPIQYDAFFQLLINLDRCPETINNFKAQIEQQGFMIKPSMVANQGRNNPILGSFSFFEIVTGNGIMPGDWFFGHFTDINDGTVSLDQNPNEGKLLIELIAWDPQKQIFNFYEWIGQGDHAIWFYRGDSLDALSDNTYLYRTPPIGEKKFGERMRCSACHISGGPIMKELATPHNDWWQNSRLLPITPNIPDYDVVNLMNKLIEANDFASAVINGINKLKQSLAFIEINNGLSLQERLRPLFCETEINLLSDPAALEQSLEYIEIPGEFFVNKFFSPKSIKISQLDYYALLDQFAMSFAKSNIADADHAWLTPVKAYTDYTAIQTLINNKLIDEDFAAAILYIDFHNPYLSDERCNLLKLLPKKITPYWQQLFIENLYLSELSSARSLAEDLDAHNNLNFYSKKIADYLSEVKNTLKTSTGRISYLKKLINLRNKVYISEISQNPLGQILEPGFRIIFPKPNINKDLL